MRKDVVAVAIIQERKVLVLWKKKRQHYEFPGGVVELLEDKEVALKREALEEIGIHIHNIKYHSQFKFRVGIDDFKIFMYTATIHHAPQLSVDFDHYVWVPISLYQSYKLAPNVLDFCRNFK